MKTPSPLLLCLCAVLLAPLSHALADDSTPPSQTAPSNGTPTDQQRQRIREAFAQLDLSDDQKQQIRQIRQTVTDKTQRRQQIMAVLTPEQKEKLKQIFLQYRANAGGGENTTGGAGDGSDLAPGAN